MASLASIAQLQARLAVDATDLVRAQALLDDASAAVRSYTGQTFSVATSTAERVRLSRSTARLPQRPVTAVTAVTDTAGTALTFHWGGGDRVRVEVAGLRPLTPFPTIEDDAVLVTYTHGYTTIPEVIVAVVCNIAARGLGSPPETAATTARSITNYSESFGPIGAAGPFGLFDEERTILDRYRRDVGVVWV